jgi:ATP/ADP translocase
MLMPKKTSKFLSLINIFTIVILLLSVSIVGSLHFHRDGLIHHDCPICLVYLTLAISFICFVPLLGMLEFSSLLTLSSLEESYLELLVTHKTPRSPPDLC